VRVSSGQGEQAIEDRRVSRRRHRVGEPLVLAEELGVGLDGAQRGLGRAVGDGLTWRRLRVAEG
jgi:hypothetical protein